MQDQINSEPNNKVLVVGGGVGGIKTALDLAEAGREVMLVDKAPSIGGLMTLLDRTFPTNNCDMCTISPYLAESGRDLNIDLLPLTEIVSTEGQAGDFTIKLRTAPRYIDLDKCSACGECHKKHPECVNFTPGLDHRAPTCMRYPQATPLAFSIDAEKCSAMDDIVAVCPDDAIIPDEAEKISEVKVGAIVLATGACLYNPDALANYGHGIYPNVVTGLEYERIMSASGPTAGDLTRPSDSKRPQKVAWIQCVGSRNINQADAPYCSSVCCMYALKEAMVTKERFQDDIEAVVFYMDMRTSGKDYELYLQRSKDEYGVRLVRCRPHTIEPHPGSDDLSITYTTDESSTPQKEVFDMVVLSTGFHVPPDVVDLAGALGIELNEWNFVKTDSFNPVTTSKKGIYVCGLLESPKDIPETLVQASAAAGMVSHDLPAKDQLAAHEEFPPERDVAGEEPKLGVFVYNYSSYEGVINPNEVAEYASGLPGVAVSEVIQHGSSEETLGHIQETIRKEQLNRVVIAGTSPRTHETLFQDTIRRAGLNKYLLEMANIRDQNVWVHSDSPEQASQKANDLVRMAVSSAAQRTPLIDHTIDMNKEVLVIGGGVTGMNAALNMAEDGFKVFLVEQAPELGGLARDLHKTLEGEDVQAYMDDLVERTKNHDNIQVLTGAIVVDHTGMPGQFKTGLQVGPQMYYRQISHGVTILATGALANRPKEYMLGEHEAVMTQRDLDSLLEENPDKFKTMDRVVMIQCVGSRVPENPNCSRVCCQSAVKNALRILDINPEIKIFVLYRDMRTYGFQEVYYRQARERGVLFARYSLDDKPVVAASGDKVEVTFHDAILDMKISVPVDCLALSTGFVADDEATEDLSMIFHLPRTEDGYFLEEHVKLKPVDLPVPGFLVAGTAHSPKSVRESITQAHAAAGRAKTLLARDVINLGAAVAKVDGDKCAACLICVRACPFDVPFINADGYSEIDPAKCHGCGICAAECPAKAIQLMQFEDDLILAKVEGLLDGIFMEGIR